MTYSPNMTVIRRIAASRIPRPDYERNQDGRPFTEDDPDNTPSRFIAGACRSCGRRYPLRALCGYCWAICRQIDTQAVRPDIIVEVPSDD